MLQTRRQTDGRTMTYSERTWTHVR